LLIGLGLLAWIIGRGLRPVNAIAGRIARVGRRSLSDRLEPSGVPRELLPIVDRLNGLLERLELAFSRERAFTADVAHELRTPLAGLETAIEVCASRTRQPQEYQKVLSQCLGVTRQMHAMVDSLLILARADGRTLAVSQTSFCLNTLLNETWKPFADRAARRRLHLIRSGEPDGPICSDREKLRQILHNLFDNAVSYADEGGTLTIRIAAQAGLVSIVVANSGSRLSQDQADHAFERFWRGDAARSETGSHCGLGLAITRELVTVIGGTISLNSSEGGDFLVHLTLPATPHQASPAKESDSPRSASRADVVSV
jgi:signal transduction histidine kinase